MNVIDIIGIKFYVTLSFLIYGYIFVVVVVNLLFFQLNKTDIHMNKNI